MIKFKTFLDYTQADKDYKEYLKDNELNENDYTIDDFYNYINGDNWEFLGEFLSDMFNQTKHNSFILKGFSSGWQGKRDCYLPKIIETSTDLLEVVSKYDDITITIDNFGKFFIDFYHHDGCNSMELLAINDKKAPQWFWEYYNYTELLDVKAYFLCNFGKVA
jgi:hypothetical protein